MKSYLEDVCNFFHGKQIKTNCTFSCFCYGYDANSCFSELDFFSGMSLWELQIETRNLMRCFIFGDYFSKMFYFDRCNSLICKMLCSNPKYEFSGVFKNFHLNQMYIFIYESTKFCKNESTLGLFTHSKNDVI